MKRTAFTMIELVLVVVILGILAAVAIPKLAATRDDAQMTKGRSDVAAIRSAIVSERQSRLLRGDSAYIAALDDATNSAGETMFDGNATTPLLQYGIVSGTGNGKWAKTGTGAYTYKVVGDAVAFTYTQTTGIFDCTHSNANCKKLTE